MIFICKIFTKKWCSRFHDSVNFRCVNSFFMVPNLKCSGKHDMFRVNSNGDGIFDFKVNNRMAS